MSTHEEIDVLIDQSLVLFFRRFAESEQCMNMRRTKEQRQELVRGDSRVAHFQAPRSTGRDEIRCDLLDGFERTLTIERAPRRFGLVRGAVECTMTPQHIIGAQQCEKSMPDERQRLSRIARI